MYIIFHALPGEYYSYKKKHKITDILHLNIFLLESSHQCYIYKIGTGIYFALSSSEPVDSTIDCHVSTQGCAHPGIFTITVTSTVIRLCLFLEGSWLVSLVRSITSGPAALGIDSWQGASGCIPKTGRRAALDMMGSLSSMVGKMGLPSLANLFSLLDVMVIGEESLIQGGLKVLT